VEETTLGETEDNGFTAKAGLGSDHATKVSFEDASLDSLGVIRVGNDTEDDGSATGCRGRGSRVCGRLRVEGIGVLGKRGCHNNISSIKRGREGIIKWK